MRHRRPTPARSGQRLRGRLRSRRLALCLRGCAPLIAITTSSTIPSIAHAADVFDVAAKHYRTGSGAIDREDYVTAVQEWTRAYDVLAESSNVKRVKHVRSVIASNIAILQMGTWERGLPPGNLESARRLLSAYIAVYEPLAGPGDPDIARVRNRLQQVEARIKGEDVQPLETTSGGVHSGSGGHRPLRLPRFIRAYPWEKFDKPIVGLEYNFELPAIKLDYEGESVKRKRGFNLVVDIWVRPRVMWQLAYHRNEFIEHPSSFENSFKMNTVSGGFSTDLLALRFKWPVQPMLLPYVRGGVVWGNRQFDEADPMTGAVQSGDRSVIGGVLLLGGHGALMVPIKGKFILMVRGGVQKPFYVLNEDGDASRIDAQYPKNLRGEFGLMFAIVP